MDTGTIDKNNGIRISISDALLTRITLVDYYKGSLPSEVKLGSFNQSAINTNEFTIGNKIDRDQSGNIISFADNSKNKNKLNVLQISRRFDKDILMYSLDYEFTEFFSEESIRNQQYRIIDDLKSQINKLLGDLNASSNEVSALKSADAAKAKQLKDAQDTISKLTKQATDIADNLAKQMQESSKASTDALKALTDGVKAEIDKLKKDLEDDKKETESALDTIRKERELQNQRANVSGVTQAQTGTSTTVTAPTVVDLFMNQTVGGSTVTQPTPADKEKTNTGAAITINKDVKLFGNTVSIALGRFETRVNDDKKKVPVIPNPTAADERNKRVLNNTNDLLIEIAIGEWYKYHKKEVSMTEGIFKRREVSHRGRLQNDNIDKVTGQMTGAIINKLTNADISFLLEKAKDYWKEVPYTQVYSQGIPYTDAEQADFEKIYPGLKGQRQIKTPPPHFLYALNIFDIPTVRSLKNTYVKI